MSGTGETTADFAGEAREFRICLGEIRRIEAKCNAPIGEVAQRLARAVVVLKAGGSLSVAEMLAAGIAIYADDVREPLYQGLIGKDMPSGEATKLLKTEIDDRGFKGLMDNAAVALLVLTATQEAPPREADLGEQKAGQNPPNASTSQNSSGSARRSGSRRGKSKR
jgi:hypothetical protein